MSEIRTVRKIVTGNATQDGAGVKLVRVIGKPDTTDFDPFLMLDAFDSTDPEDYVKGFPWHPHRGIETITYLIEGDIEHGDSLGNKGSILDGECQWMTAGSGIIHQEMPQAAPRMLGAQLWLNLPAAHKMSEPKYNGITKADIPVVEEAEGTVRVIGGNYNGMDGAMAGDHVKPLLLDVDISSGGSWHLAVPANDTLFLYIFSGEGAFDEREKDFIAARQAVLFNPGSELKVKASPAGIRFLLMSAPPLKEPIAWGGPIVMNTKEELNLAFRELQEKTFIKHQ